MARICRPLMASKGFEKAKHGGQGATETALTLSKITGKLNVSGSECISQVQGYGRGESSRRFQRNRYRHRTIVVLDGQHGIGGLDCFRWIRGGHAGSQLQVANLACLRSF